MNGNDMCRRVFNSRAVKGTKRFFTNHGADIFAILAGIGVFATGVSAFSAGKKIGSQKELRGTEDASSETGQEDNGERESDAKLLVPPVVFGTITVGSIAASRVLGRKREESLLAAGAALTAYYSRKCKLEEKGMGRGEGCRLPRNASNIESTGTEDILFIEDFTGRKFRTTWAEYEDAKRKLQEQFSISQCVVLNDFYELLGLEKTNAGEILGWTIDQMILGRLYDGETIPYEDALTQLCIEEDTDDDGNVVIYYCILPIGGLAGVGPCNY